MVNGWLIDLQNFVHSFEGMRLRESNREKSLGQSGMLIYLKKEPWEKAHLILSSKLNFDLFKTRSSGRCRKFRTCAFKGTRFQKCWRKLTDLGLDKGRGWFLIFFLAGDGSCFLNRWTSICLQPWRSGKMQEIKSFMFRVTEQRVLTWAVLSVLVKGTIINHYFLICTVRLLY